MKYDDVQDIPPKQEEAKKDEPKNEEAVKNENGSASKETKKDEKVTEKEPVESNKEEDKKSEEGSEEDPFVYKFDSGSSEGSKKSGDGIWLAIVAIVVVVAIIIIGTSRQNAQEKADDTSEQEQTSIISDESPEDSSDEMKEAEEGDVQDEEQSEDQAEEPTETEEEDVQESREEELAPAGPSVEASSTLIDTSALKFDYSPGQVTDKDFSTAWIEAERDAGIDEFIQVNFGEEKEVERLGIVPGYGRDEDIYKENNRVKKLVLEFSDGSSVERELEDKYAMHMIDFDRRKTSSVKIIIKEVYSGSKYNDTAISEIDVESDYVINNDPDGALRFYEENKKANAKRPS